jgi:hypothetical protein
VAGVIHKQADRADRLDLFLPEGTYVPVANSLIGGEFIGPIHSSDLTGLFFSKVEPELFDFEEVELDDKNDAVMFHISYCDGLALFVSPNSNEAPNQLSELLNGPFISNEELLSKAIGLYEVIVTTHADGDFFGCFAKERSKFEILQSALDTAVADIKETRWFQESKFDLVWDGQYSMCLVENNNSRKNGVKPA